MSEQQAAATAALENLTDEQFRQYRNTGELPAAPAESATVDTQESTESEAQTESAGESETPKTEETQEQSRKPKNAAQRIAQLEQAIEAEWAKDDPDVVRIGQLNATIDKIQGRPKRKTEAAPPQAAEQSQPQKPQQSAQNFEQWAAQFDVDKWEEDYAKAHPEASWARMQLDKDIYINGAQKHFDAIEQQIRTQRQELEKIANEARERYEDFDEIKDSFLAKTISSNQQPLVPIPVLALINSSPRMADIMYTLGNDEAELNRFVEMAKTDPNQAIRYVAKVETLIDEEFSKQAAPEPKAPEKRQTQAPKPVTPVGGSTSRAFDVNDESLSDDEWFRQRNRQLGIK